MNLRKKRKVNEIEKQKDKKDICELGHKENCRTQESLTKTKLQTKLASQKIEAHFG